MLMNGTSSLAVEVLVKVTGQGSRERMNAAELSGRIDGEVPLLKQVLNPMTRAGLVRAKAVQQPAIV